MKCFSLKPLLLAIAGVSLVCVTNHAFADAYLVGAVVYASSSTGANAGAYSGTPYQFSTNSNTTHVDLDVNGEDSAISFLLTSGLNTFSFSPDSNDFPVDIVGLELFFNSTGTSYNPAFASGVGVPGDLAAFVNAGSSAFSTPGAGTDVQSYNTTGDSVNSADYSGATTFVVDGEAISISAFSAANVPSGSFTVDVTPVPEPASGLLVAMGGLFVAMWGVRGAERRLGRRGTV